MNTIEALSAYFFEALQHCFPEHNLEVFLIEITPSTKETFGHYQCNSAMKLSSLLKQKPRDIAARLLNELQNNQKLTNMVAHVEMAGPGFINIYLNPNYLAACMQTMLKSPKLGIKMHRKPQRIVIDFSGPNTAKEMHVGHLRSTIIGDCLARLFEFLGDDVLRLNHVGDWGTAFGMLIAEMKEHAPEVLEGKEATDLSQLMAWYRHSKTRFDTDENFKWRAQQEVVALQRGDALSLHAWQIVCKVSRKAYQEIYDLLDISLIERGESFYNHMLMDLVADLEQKNLVTISEGAKCIFLENFSNREGGLLPLMVQKSDGGFNYATTDMAALYHRLKIEKADRVIYVTDAGQVNHFKMIFAAAQRAGFLDPKHHRVDHVTFGVVLGPDGKKFKTRSGETERLIDLLTKAIERAYAILIDRNPQMDKHEAAERAKILGINAIKYADLSSQRTNDYVFSYERMLRFEGNTAAFLMYAYVRINSLKRKIGIDVEVLKQTATIKLIHPAEINLALLLNQFSEVLTQLTQDLLPHRLTDYLYKLAEQFNIFFRDCRVQGDPAQNSRLLLCEVVANVMTCGFHLLGLKTVERM